MERAYGGVLINKQGQVLLREPAGHYDNYVWTFAKGKSDPGESPEETALREVLEETGIRAKIVTKIPGTFDGSTTRNEYFLMVPIMDTKEFKDETCSVRWASLDEAKILISKTRNAAGKIRDLQVLDVASKMFAKFTSVS